MPPALTLLACKPFALCAPSLARVLHARCLHPAFLNLTPAPRPNNRVSRKIGRTVNLRQSAAKLDVLSRSSSPLADQYGVAHLLSCAAASLIDRGRRLTDEAFRTRIGKPSAGSSGCLFHVFAPVWHSGALLRASNRRGRASRVDSWTGTLIGLGPQSK